MSYNDRIYGQFIAAAVPQIATADRLWLGNRLGKLYRKGRGNNYRLCMADSTGSTNARYKAIAANDSAASIDKQLINPQTGNVFWFGFNAKGKGRG